MISNIIGTFLFSDCLSRVFTVARVASGPLSHLPKSSGRNNTRLRRIDGRGVK